MIVAIMEQNKEEETAIEPSSYSMPYTPSLKKLEAP